MLHNINTRDCPVCDACGAEGEPLYAGLEDVLYHVPGKWNISKCTDSSCGLLWLDPMLKKEEIHKAYLSYSTHQDFIRKESLSARILRKSYAGYRAYRYGFNPSNVSLCDKLLGMMVSVLPPTRQQMSFPFTHFDGVRKTRMLEIGCGGGDSLKIFADWGWKTEGLDFDQAAVANARAKGLKVWHGDVFSCKYEANSFDAIYASHVLEHVPEPEKLLKESLRILSPGGRCVILTPNAASVGHRWFKSFWRGLEPPRHLHIFTPEALAGLARSAGFIDVSVKTSSRLAASIYIESEMMRKSGKTEAKASFMLKIGAMLVHYVAYVLCLVNAKSGEELVLMGSKRNDNSPSAHNRDA